MGSDSALAGFPPFSLARGVKVRVGMAVGVFVGSGLGVWGGRRRGIGWSGWLRGVGGWYMCWR